MSRGTHTRCFRGLDVFMAPRMWRAPPPTAAARYMMYQDAPPAERFPPSPAQWYLLDGMKCVGQEELLGDYQVFLGHAVLVKNKVVSGE